MNSETMNRSVCIHPEYNARVDPIQFDDCPMRDEWQDEVYAEARDLCLTRGLRSIIDFGCGSGFKLMKYFSGYHTVGYDIPVTVDYLNKNYPDRHWRDDYPDRFTCDLLISADVIEHMTDPTNFLRSAASSPLQFVVLSTPSLEILAERGESPRLGPPDNKSHVREWTTREFRDFVDMYLDVIDHRVVSVRQGTQMIVARPRR